MTNPNSTYLCVIGDRSGSMRPIASDMEGAIKTLLEEQGKLPGELHVDIVTFDDTVEVRYEDVRADDVKHQLIEPRGMTALSDAIGLTILRLGSKFSEMNEEDRPGKIIIAVATDGGENSSHEFAGAEGAARVKAMLEKQRDEYGWEFLFLGVGIDAWQHAQQYGYQRGQTISLSHDAGGTQVFAAAASGYATRSRAGEDVSAGFSDAEREGEVH